jgi:propionyl-CoA carboxylase alpha chain
VDSGFEEGQTIPVYYDPMIAKLVVHGNNRTEAIQRMIRAIDDYKIDGIANTLQFGRFVMEHESFVSGKFDTHFVAKHFTPEALIEHPTDEENIVSALFSAHYNAESENHTAVVESVAHPAHYSGWKKRAYKR